MSVTERLAEYLASCRYESLPSEVVVRTKQLLLDTIGAMLAGTALRTGVAIRDFVEARPGIPEAAVVGSTLRTDVMSAALANSTCAHADEVDDSHFGSLTHPAAATIPAALVLGETRKASGQQVITAINAGYDAQCRVSKALDPRKLQSRGFMPLAVCSHFGAAAAASVMLQLSPLGVRNALGLVGCQAGGLWACATDASHMTKALMIGAPVRDGVFSAMLAEAGFEGPPAVLEGRDGVLGAFSDVARPEEITAELGSRFEIMLTSIKKHACGGPIRGPVDGLLDILTREGIRAADIRTIRVRLARSGCEIVDNRGDLPISLQYVMAVAAVDGRVGVEQTHSRDRIDDPQVQDLRRRVELIPDDEFEKVWPAMRPALTEVELISGTTYSQRVDHAAGSPERPMTQEEVEAKFRNLAGLVCDEATVDEIIDRVNHFDAMTDVGPLALLLQRTRPVVLQH